MTSLRGHVAPVYQCAWSADSRLLVSSSKDSTLKVWDIRTGKMKEDLPGHQDEVFAVDLIQIKGHHLVGPEIRRELLEGRGRGVEVEMMDTDLMLE